MEYKINGVDENGESIIEKRGHVITFTIREVIEHQKKMERTLTELEATKSVLDAKVQNVIDFHPEINKMTDEELHNAWFFFENKRKADQYAKKIKEIKDFFEENKKELEEIATQTGIEIPEEGEEVEIKVEEVTEPTDGETSN